MAVGLGRPGAEASGGAACTPADSCMPLGRPMRTTSPSLETLRS